MSAEHEPINREQVKRNYERFIQWLIPVVVSVLLIFFTLYTDNANNHKFCGIIAAATTPAVPKPANTKVKPAQETQYQWYVRLVDLGHTLGC